MPAKEGVINRAENLEQADFFAGLTESAAIVVARVGADDCGRDDELLVSMKVSDLVAEFIDMRTANGEIKLSDAALEGAKRIREDMVVALKALNTQILAAEVRAVSGPKLG